MSIKPIRPHKPPARPGPGLAKQRHSAPDDHAQRQPDRRWQRTVRYGWDKGGSRGGR